MRRLCQMCGEPLALTSANISSHSSTVAVHVSENVWGKKTNMFLKIVFIKFPSILIPVRRVFLFVLSLYRLILSKLLFNLQCCCVFPPEGVSGTLAQTGSGGGRRTNWRPEPPRINSGRPISARQIPHHQTRLVSSYRDPVSFHWLQFFFSLSK